MKKAQVLTRFMLLAIIWVLLGAAAGAVIGTAIVGWAGWLLFGVAVAAIALLAWGAFTPNSPLFGRVIDGNGTPDRVIALTFDDGPSAETTPRVLEELRERDVQATFFVLGRHAAEHPELVAEIRCKRAPGRIARLRPRAADVRDDGPGHRAARSEPRSRSRRRQARIRPRSSARLTASATSSCTGRRRGAAIASSAGRRACGIRRSRASRRS